MIKDNNTLNKKSSGIFVGKAETLLKQFQALFENTPTK